MKRFFYLFLLVGFFFVSNNAYSISAFARKYKVDCSSCHTGGTWKLNKYGQDFFRYGHMNEGEKVEGTLFDYFSLAYKWRYLGGNTKLETFEDHAMSIYTGGPLGKGWSYFSEFYLHENSGLTGKDSKETDFGDYGRSKLAESYIQYTNGSMEKYFSIRFGNIAPQLLHIHGLGARVEQSRNYVMSGAKVGSNPFTIFARQAGIDFTYHINEFTTAIGIVNGTGYGGQFNMVDNNQYKDTYFTLDYNFSNEGSKIGLYYYNGKYPLTDYEDKFKRFGVVGNFSIKHFSFIGAYINGENTVNAAGLKADNSGYFATILYYPSDKFGIYARIDQFDPRDDVDNDDKDGITGGLSMYLSDWARIVGEYTRFGGDDKTNSFVIEVNLMF